MDLSAARLYSSSEGNFQFENVFGIARVIICNNGLRATGLEALCITLRRLAYTNRYVDLLKPFPRTRCELSMIFNRTVFLLRNKHDHLLSGLTHPWLTMDYVELLSQAIHMKGAPYEDCFGFLGTVRPTCRPGKNQGESYNGQKRVRAQKFQSVIVPDATIACMFGAVKGRRHDAFILSASHPLEDLEE